MSLNLGTLSVTFYLHFKRGEAFLLTVLKSGMLKWNLKCFKIKCFTVRKDIMRSLGKLPKMFLFLPVCKICLAAAALGMKKTLN